MKHGVIVLLLLFTGLMASPQDVSFSQFFSNPLYINPAFAGLSNHIRLGLAFRDQGLTSAGFTTCGFSADAPFFADESGIGIVVLKDQAGMFSSQSGMLNYSYRVNLSRNYTLSLGLKSGVVQYHSEASRIDGDGITELVPALTYSEFDAGAGILIFGKNQLAGLAVEHLSRPLSHTGNYIRQNEKITANYGIFIDIHQHGSKIATCSVSPNFLFVKQGIFNQCSYGMYLILNNVTAGVWIRQNFPVQISSFILVVGYQAMHWRAGYSYDINTMRGGIPGYCTHEVTLGYFIEPFTIKTKMKAIKCPSF